MTDDTIILAPGDTIPEAANLACEWFARCDNTATFAHPHPILTVVPVCERCRAKVEALS